MNESLKPFVYGALIGAVISYFIFNPGFKVPLIKESDIEPEALEEGAEIEMEHTTHPRVARKIALDHLAEDPLYYKKLKEAHL